MPLSKRLLLVFVLLASSVGCDQATKQLASSTLGQGPSYSFLGDSLRLGCIENRGAFLSLGGGLSDELRFWFFTAGVGALLLGIGIYTLTSRKLEPTRIAGFSLVLGGGISNWVDRVVNHGQVVDFMNVGIGRLRTGVFNVADLAIVAGIGVLVLSNWRKRQPADVPPPPTMS
jgi:signal peptidase II